MRKILSITLVIFIGLCGVAFGQSSLDLSSDTIPKGFKGDDIVGVVKSLRSGTFHKDKFIFTGNKEDVEKVYTFKVSDDVVLSSRDGVWIEKTTKGIWPHELTMEGSFYLIKDMGSKQKNWSGQNVFGARTRVESESETKYFVIPDRDIGKLPVKPTGGKIGVLFIGKPMEPDNSGVQIPRFGYVAYVGQGYRPTIDMPYETVRNFYGLRLNLQEVVVYDQDTGKVLLNQKLAKQIEPESAKTMWPQQPTGLRPPPTRAY